MHSTDDQAAVPAVNEADALEQQIPAVPGPAEGMGAQGSTPAAADPLLPEGSEADRLDQNADAGAGDAGEEEHPRDRRHKSRPGADACTAPMAVDSGKNSNQEQKMTDAPTHDELALPEYDHIPLGTLPSRIQPLSEEGVSGLLAYEKEHGNRLPVVQVLEHRLEALRGGAEPSGTLPEDLPEVTRNQQGSPVSPATTGPKINPPSHGDPTNPAQPRR